MFPTFCTLKSAKCSCGFPMPHITHPPVKKLSEVCHQIWEILSARIKNPITTSILQADKYRNIYRYWIKLYKSRGKIPIQKRWSTFFLWASSSLAAKGRTHSWCPCRYHQRSEALALGNFPPMIKWRLWSIPSALISNIAAWFCFPIQITMFSTFQAYLKKVLMLKFS